MPYKLDPPEICLKCPYGVCIEYLGDKNFKDRETKYRLRQNIISWCAFDRWLPGSWADDADKDAADSNTSWSALLNQIVVNGKQAGTTLTNHHHVTALPSGFFLTQQQIGKVRGDVFQMLVGATLWNACVRRNTKRSESTDSLFVAITLGDNYDLGQLLTPEDAKKFRQLQNALTLSNTKLAYSTPDFVVIDIKAGSKDLTKNFSEELTNFNPSNQTKLTRARSLLEGKINGVDIIAAIGLKTSIRSDRMYQLLFEANAWKFIWKAAFEATPSRYYAVYSGDYGADPEKLSSVNFSSYNSNNKTALRAIDGVVNTQTPTDLIAAFEAILMPIVHKSQTDI